MTKTPGQNCLPGSAWETWQLAGANWRAKNPDATPEEAEAAARDYAAARPWFNQRLVSAAFLECAL